MIEVVPLEIEDIKLIRPRRFGDNRGFFCESWNQRDFAAIGVDHAFCQDNHSLSRQRGTVRGLHFQADPFAQTKLIRVLRGAIFDVAVDIRSGSPTFGRHVSTTLSAEDGAQLLVPRGFAHGFCTLEPDTEIAYKVDAYYDRASDLGIIWDDPELAIRWPVARNETVMSDKDRLLPRFSSLPDYFRYYEAA